MLLSKCNWLIDNVKRPIYWFHNIKSKEFKMSVYEDPNYYTSKKLLKIN